MSGVAAEDILTPSGFGEVSSASGARSEGGLAAMINKLLYTLYEARPVRCVRRYIDTAKDVV